MIEGMLAEGLIFGIMVLGVFTTYRVLNFCDMTVDGSFPMGGAVMAVLLLKGVNPMLALAVAAAAGILAGLVTTFICTKFHIPDLLAGILMMTMLYSVNLRIMGCANISLYGMNTVFSSGIAASLADKIGEEWCIVVVMVLFALFIKCVLDLFFHTDMGLTMGALGSNEQMVISQGVNPVILRGIGICLGNAFAALSGAFYAMYQGFADVGSGSGVVVSGLASLMLGEFILKSNKIGVQTLRVLIGSIIYRALMYLARNYGFVIGMRADDLKLISGLLIILCLALSRTNLGSLAKSKLKSAKGRQK